MSRRLIILEGPDGAGKSTLAQELGAGWVQPRHFTRTPTLRRSVARYYVEAMAPAILGYGDVIMDRSWLSEKPYADAFWEGENRLSPEQIRMLERIAMRAKVTLIRCDPGFDIVALNYMKRKDTEMLDNVDQLQQVYEAYKATTSALPTLYYDYTKDDLPNCDNLPCTRAHAADSSTAGNRDGKIMIITPELHEPTDLDSYYRYPMAAFSGAGNSRWLTSQLIANGLWEDQVFWCPATHLHEAEGWTGDRIIALGTIAGSAARERGWTVSAELPHPTRFRVQFPKNIYPLTEIIHG